MSSLLIESVDEALRNIFSPNTMKAVYFYLEENRQIRRDQLHDKLGEFVDSCKQIFGAGSQTLERAIAKKLYSKLGWEFWEVPNFGLLEYVEKAKQRLARESGKRVATLQLDEFEDLSEPNRM